MRVLVTGASGFLGEAVVRGLATRHTVIGQCHRHRHAGLVSCDLRDAAAVQALVREARPDAVVHAAADREPDFCEEHPAETARLNEGAARAFVAALPPKAHLLFISSDYVFDGTRPPYAEDAPRAPCNVYGRQKAAGEDVVLARCGALVLRIPVLIGVGDTLATAGYVGQLINTVRDKTPVVQDHVLVRVPTAVDDVGAALAVLIERGASGVFHAAGPRAATRFESALEVARLLGESSDHIRPSTEVVVRRAPRPVDASLSTARLQALGYACRTDLLDVVRRQLANNS